MAVMCGVRVLSVGDLEVDDIKRIVFSPGKKSERLDYWGLRLKASEWRRNRNSSRKGNERFAAGYIATTDLNIHAPTRKQDKKERRLAREQNQVPRKKGNEEKKKHKPGAGPDSLSSVSRVSDFLGPGKKR